MSLESQLARGLAEMQLELPAEARFTLLAYLRLVEKWNHVYNLTAIRSIETMLTHHVLDSLAVVRHITGERIADVGSGAGLPGIPLSIALPNAHVTLVDSNHKKAAFLQQAAIELPLGNVDVVCERVESWQPPHRFDVVISRAFAELGEFVAAAGHLCRADGVLAAMKGVHPYEELAQLPTGYAVKEVLSVNVPGVEAKRHLVLLQPVAVNAISG